ncbi:IclR family transcriptional regulator [Neomicrococcus lactis]|uniref:DNA-binding IclR family transcriptional regulator n=1 Tax=Neomicrococcus lactis TaxID=732241 RepID=A0A7W9DB00_9MICC|nr:IclR family transcriptional regulator [Neomicrococcus lactis]MBB5597337.1 DNA-binding IclR family transcriptional regulator [Neomicrococcus lactis]
MSAKNSGANDVHLDPRQPPGTQTLARGLDVLRAVAQGADDLRAVAEATGLGRSTAHRLVQLLELYGYLRVANGRNYSLGPTLIEYGFQALHQNPLPVVARPVIEELAAKVQDTVHLAIEETGQVLYLDKIPGLRGAEMRSRIGHRMPLTTTGIGKALIIDRKNDWQRLFETEHQAEVGSEDAGSQDFLNRMRDYAKAGASMDLEENEPGIRCVAAPIRDASGGVLAAVSVSATRPFMPMQRMRALVPVMQKAALQISQSLGYAG